MLKVLLSAAAFSIGFFTPSDLLAGIPAKLTTVNVKRSNTGVSIDLVFDRPMAAKSLKPTYERNFVQFALKPAKLDRAAIQAVDGSEVQKIFTYPYSPDTARMRVILRKD